MKLKYRAEALEKVVQYVANHSKYFLHRHSEIRERIMSTMRQMLDSPSKGYFIATMGFYVAKDENSDLISVGIDMNVFSDLDAPLTQLEPAKPAQSTASIKNYTGETLTIQGKKYRLEEI